MENTGKVLFEDDSPQWFIAQGEGWVGPLTASDVYQKILSQELSWAHFVWKAGQGEWKRLCDVKSFQVAVPTLPKKQMQQEVKEASRPGVRKAPASKSPPLPPRKEEKTWYLFYSEAQFGPFSVEEVRRFLQVGKIHGRVYAWCDGMGDWARLETLELFESEVAQASQVREQKKKPAAPKENRSAPRRPLVAKILMANQESVIVAVCRDVSVGGMQVLTDRIPGAVGARIKMNVSPANRVGKGEKEIEPFVAQGEIVRILEDGCGFSFRFDRLPEASLRAIEKYIQSAS
jgi:hypothetical protein